MPCLPTAKRVPPPAWPLVALVLLVLVGLPASARARVARLVKDIEHASYGCFPSDLVPARSALFFGTKAGCRGDAALWRTDGTTAGTVRVQGFPPAGVASVVPMLAIGDVVYFGLVPPSEVDEPIRELWRSDGSEQGTTPLHAFATGSIAGPPYPGSGRASFAALGDQFVFGAGDGSEAGLWVTDGTPEGTLAVTPEGAGSLWPENFVQRGADLFVLMQGASGYALWRTDGTAAGTELVIDLQFTYDDPTEPPQDSWSIPHPGIALGPDGALYFARSFPSGAHELWRSGGTAATTGPAFTLPFASSWLLVGDKHLVLEARRGVARVSRWNPSDRSLSLVHDFAPPPLGLNSFTIDAVRDGVLYLSPSVHLVGDQLWRTDGTPGGTFELYGEALQGILAPAAGGLLFRADPLFAPDPYVITDGTQAGTVQIIPPDPELVEYDAVTPLGDATLFGRYRQRAIQLMRTDGTAPGTSALGRLPAMPRSLVALGGVAAFISESTLWRSDGTVGGTFPLAELGVDTLSSVPHALTDVDGALFFAVDRAQGQANELWRSDGTRAGTTLVADFPDGDDMLGYLTASGGRLFFTRGASEVWTSDGSAAGTQRLLDAGAVAEIHDVAGRAFVAVHGAKPTKGSLWRSDGSADGTVQLADVAASGLTAFDGALYFVGRAARAVAGLWRSDGSVAGTAPLATFSAVSERRTPLLGTLFPAEHALYFSVGRRDRTELWRSDGDASGTTRVATLAAGPKRHGFYGLAGVEYGAVVDDQLVFSFTSGFDPGTPNLWRSDGSEAGTKPIAAISPFVELGPFVRVGERVLFTNPSPRVPINLAAELWASDGTEQGTVRLLAGGFGTIFGPIGDVAYLCVFRDDKARVWQTDGTPAGTQPAFSGSLPCPGELVASGDRLFLDGSTRQTGVELWSILAGP